MADIDLKRFVKINIANHVQNTISGTRDTVVLFTSEGTASEDNIFSAYSEVAAHFSENDSENDSATTTKAYAKVYFDNGGVNLRIIEAISALTDDMITALGNDYIIIAYAASSSYSTLKSIAASRESSKSGIDEKILLASTNSTESAVSTKNFAVKYSAVTGAEMTIAAYLSKINVYGVDTVHDYMFTKENIASEDIADSIYGTIISNNMNVDILLAGAVRNCGGNCTDGEELVNSFVRIILHQTLTNKLIGVLTQKIKDNSGSAKIYTALVQELENYKTCGYLSTDKFWSDEDLNISYNGVNYNIISKGTQLQNGYHVVVLPMSNISDTDKSLHKCPPIYIVIADQYSIRYIEIDGEII